MATNVADFTRFMKHSRGVYWQGFFLPFISLMLGVFGIISTSAAKVVYGRYIWDPSALAGQWDGPGGRCGAFFVGFAWVVAQIGTNLSANVISASNDLVNLFPKYISIRRGVIVITVTAGWIMVPWKILHDAQSLLTFMAGLAIFLAPIASIMACDYWLVKRRKIDVPSLYRRHARYRYDYGINWRAAIAFLVSVVPNTPGSVQLQALHVQVTNVLQPGQASQFNHRHQHRCYSHLRYELPVRIRQRIGYLLDPVENISSKGDAVVGVYL